MIGTPTKVLAVSATLLWTFVITTHGSDIISTFLQLPQRTRMVTKNSKSDSPLLHEQETTAAIWQSFFTSPDNYLDPDAGKNLSELITGQGYRYENYTIETSDGFLLDLHRIPNGRKGPTACGKCQGQNKPVVFLQHGLLSSACDWVINFAEESLGFILADAGYDVWMGNSRGNTYSRRHVHLKPSADEFWDWSFDEMALYDLPAFLDFVLQATEAATLSFIGHSQGTTMAFALFSQRPDLAKKIQLFVALAPVIQITHTQAPIKYLAPLPDNIIYDIVGRKDFLSNSKSLKHFGDVFCKNAMTEWLCVDLMFLFTGTDLSNLNQTRLPVYTSHTPAGASVKDMVHFAQLFREKKFAMYDYGSSLENQKHYNQSKPLEYNLTRVNVPVVAFTGTNDKMADPKDAAALLKSLPNVKAKYELPGWNHMDFVWGVDAAKLCYATILQWLDIVAS